MSVQVSDNIKTFADTAYQLYRVFFRKYPMFKVLIMNVMLNNSGNFVLSLMERGQLLGHYTIYTSDEGNIIKNGIDNKASIGFKVQKSILEDLVKNKELYIKKPYKLFKFIPSVLNSISIRKDLEEENHLKGNKVILRQGREEDIFYLSKWYNDKELNKLAGWSEGKYRIFQIRKSISKGFGYDPMNLIIETINQKPIGTIQLYDFNEQDRNCKLGIRIGDRDYWNKGYGEDAISTLLMFAFYKLDMYRVSLKFYEYNERASNCYMKCGFKNEGRTRKSAFIDGKFYDEILMGILKSDFINKYNQVI